MHISNLNIKWDELPTHKRNPQEIIKEMEELIVKINACPDMDEVKILWDVYDHLERHLCEAKTGKDFVFWVNRLKMDD